MLATITIVSLLACLSISFELTVPAVVLSLLDVAIACHTFG